jgi:hypothetical protein
LDRARASSAISSAAVTSIITWFPPGCGQIRLASLTSDYGGKLAPDQPTQTGARHASSAHWTAQAKAA